MTADESGARGQQDARGLDALPHRSARDLREALREAIGFLDGLAIGLSFWTGNERHDVASRIRDEATNLSELLAEVGSDG